MTENWARRQDYYQKIARAFLKHQPSLFFIPPRDLELISEWEKLNLPLEVILEGIERAFARRLAGRRRKNIYSLSQCEKEILKAYAQHQERLVGQQAAQARRPAEKAARILGEIRTGLEALPGDWPAVRQILEEALDALQADPPEEARLEALDEELDRILYELTPEAERKKELEAARQDYPGRTDSQLEEIGRTRIAREKRQLLKLPRLALFYY
ncbi:MAG: hypothetical protein QME85_06130 [Candidatus Saccharicenans sp.]|nr:hypothetical protein [Candidatus Saccharicenans sp.]MDI6848171.1 hypothetical protein [Candidatus Saccharicenans sp.]